MATSEEKTWLWGAEANQSRGRACGVEVAGIAGTYTSSTLEAAQIANGGHSTTAHLPIHNKSPHMSY